MICSFSNDTVAPKVNVGQCLLINERVLFLRKMKRKWAVLDWSSILQPDTLLLLEGYCSTRGRCLLVSVHKWANAVSEKGEERMKCTWLIINASAKYFAPSSLMLFSVRLMIVSVYRWMRECRFWERWRANEVYLINLQCFSQILCSFVTNLVSRKADVC
jgi:hypothetical protein